MSNCGGLASSCFLLASTFDTDIFCSAGEMRKTAQAGGENGYLYLLAPELGSQVPGGFLTQCSTN